MKVLVTGSAGFIADDDNGEYWLLNVEGTTDSAALHRTIWKGFFFNESYLAVDVGHS